MLKGIASADRFLSSLKPAWRTSSSLCLRFIRLTKSSARKGERPMPAEGASSAAWSGSSSAGAAASSGTIREDGAMGNGDGAMRLLLKAARGRCFTQ